MVFSSLLFFFPFPVCVTSYLALVRPGCRNTVPPAESLLFYSWGEPRSLPVMLLLIIVNYHAALLIEKPAGRLPVLRMYS